MAISLKSMRYFHTAVTLGSIARAADQLNIAASAVSVAIDHIEETFALTLVTRRRARGIEATASGRLIAQKFERLLEDYDAILAEGSDLRDSVSGELRVGYYAPVAPAFLPRVFQSFLPPSRDVVLHLEDCDNQTAQDGLQSGAYDVILFVSEGVKPAIDYDVLVKAPAFCLFSATHPLAQKDSVSMAEISKEPLVILNRPFASAYYHTLFEGFTAEISVAAYASSTEMVRSLVSEGFGCAVLNMLPVTDVSYAGHAVVSVPISDPLPPLTLAIAYDRKRPRRIVQHFVDACRAELTTQNMQRYVVKPKTR